MAERSKVDKAISSLVSEMSHYVYPLKENYVVFKSRLLAHFSAKTGSLHTSSGEPLTTSGLPLKEALLRMHSCRMASVFFETPETGSFKNKTKQISSNIRQEAVPS